MARLSLLVLSLALALVLVPLLFPLPPFLPPLPCHSNQLREVLKQKRGTAPFLLLLFSVTVLTPSTLVTMTSRSKDATIRSTRHLMVTMKNGDYACYFYDVGITDYYVDDDAGEQK